MPSVLNRIRRKSTSSLASLKAQSREHVFEVSVDAPPVPTLPPKTSVMTTAQARRSTLPPAKRDLPDAVLIRIFTFLTIGSKPLVLDSIGSNTKPPTNPGGTSDTGPGIRALGRCTLTSRRFNRLASPVLYANVSYDDGYRHDPFLDMQSGTFQSARHRFTKLVSPSSPSATRKAALLAGTRSLTVSYHWHAWCNARPLVPRLPNLDVLRIQLDARSRDNGLHVDRKEAAKTCRMLDRVRAGTVVIHGVSLWSTKSVWEHLPASISEKADRVVYVITPTRPPSRGVKTEGGDRGVPLHISMQPTGLRRGKEVEIVLVFETEWGKAFEVECDGKEPNGLPAGDPCGWVGGLIGELAEVLKRKQGIKRITLVNADTLALPSAGRAEPQAGRGGEVVRKLEQCLESGPQVVGRTTRQYLQGEMREGELEWSNIRPYVDRGDYDFTSRLPVKDEQASERKSEAGARGGLEVWYKDIKAASKPRGVRFS